MSKIEWITHRRPDSGDGNAIGEVLTETGLVNFRDVVSRARWIPVPGEPRSVKQVVEQLDDLTSGSKTPGLVVVTDWYCQLVYVVEELKKLTQENDK